MKIVEKEIKKIEKVKTYISDDGMEFMSEESCRQWENSYKFLLTTAINKIPHIVTNGFESYIPSGDENEEVWILRPRDIKDIEIINKYGLMLTGNNPNLTQNDIGKILMIDFGFYNDWCDVYDMYKYLNTITNTYANFDKQLSQKERDTNESGNYEKENR